MNKKQAILLFFLLFSLVGVSCAQNSEELEFNLDLNSPAVTLPKIYKPSVDLSGRGAHHDITWPQTLAAKGALETWQADLGFTNFYRLQYNLWEIEQLAQDKPAQTKLLDNYEAIIKQISDSGGVVILNLCSTPSGLGKVLDKNSPPHNLKVYKERVKDIIRQLSCNKKYNIWYEVWNAPDLGDFFLGERLEYLNLYRVVGEAVKELRQETKISIPLGGPAVSCWFGNIESNNILTPERSLIYELIKYCYNYRLPLDFISWHAYSSDAQIEKQDTIYNKSFIKLVREWLSYFHFESNLPLIIDEWNFDAGANILPERGKDAYVAASFIPARLKNMQEAGVDYQTYFCLEDFGGNPEGATRNLGIFAFDIEHAERKGYTKASYNVFRMLNLLGSELLPVQSADEFVGLIATKSADYLAVLIYNYIDPAAAMNYLSRDIVYLNSVEKNVVFNIVKSDRIEKILSGQLDLSTLRLTPKVRNMFNHALELNNLVKKFSAASRKIKISFKNAKDIYMLSSYVVDNSCSRDCAFNSSEEQEINFNQGYSQTMELTPYSAQLLVFKKRPLVTVEKEPVAKVVEEPVTKVVEEPKKMQTIKNKHIYSVSEITQTIKGLLEDKIGEVWLEGEVLNFKAYTSGHLYFSLKDQGAIISAAMFAYANKGLKFKLEGGLKVICFGKINVYGPRGQYQIIIERIEPKGVGAQQLAFEQLKKKLGEEGLFDPAHKKPLPLMPFSVGIVTSSKGAAVRDILQILKKGAPCVDVVIRSVRVQGEQAASEIAEAIEDLNTFDKLDLIIISRGGGSTEDLWSFNEEIVVRAIYNSHLPVISAVGHQINTTLSDLVADIFVETPSAAAKVIVDKKNALLAQLAGFKYELDFSVNDTMSDLKNRLVALTHMLKSPADRLLEKQQLLDELCSGLNDNMRHFLELAQERSSSLIARLGTLSPLSVLSRGYSLSMLMPQGAILKDINQIKPGDKLKTVLHKGVFLSLVQEVIDTAVNPS